VIACKRVRRGGEDVRERRSRRPPGGASVVTRKRLPVDREDVEAAARAGHLEVFRWARDNGCPDLRDWERIAVAGGWMAYSDN
jgi:hypothetical protein